jgi:hypothetical protein
MKKSLENAFADVGPWQIQAFRLHQPHANASNYPYQSVGAFRKKATK